MITVAVLLRLISLVAATLTVVTTVAEVSFSFCFILTAIDGTRRFEGVTVGLPRLPALVKLLASLALLLPLLLFVEMLADIRLLVLLLVLLGESIFPPPPPDDAANRWPKLLEWWVSSLIPTVAPDDDLSRAAARSLEDLVVRIGC